MYFHNYLSDSSGQKISTYSQLEEGVRKSKFHCFKKLTHTNMEIHVRKKLFLGGFSDS